MSAKTYQLPEDVHAYLMKTTVRETDAQRRLREETRGLPMAGMQISPEQGQLMRLLIEMMGARLAIEVGTFTGYSALCVAMALPVGGRLVCCDVSEEWTAIGRRYWREAGVEEKIELRIGEAAETLAQLLREGGAGRFDFFFIDADKAAYDTYYELGLQLLRPGGLIAVDNALWQGRVADPRETDGETAALRALNAKAGRDPRVTASLVPIGDGLLLARKRA